MGGKRLSAATIKKEIVTLRTAWNWADKMALVAGRFPYHGLRYPLVACCENHFATHPCSPPFSSAREQLGRMGANSVAQPAWRTTRPLSRRDPPIPPPSPGSVVASGLDRP